ncbi:bifunctional metallophosphatase/5'-nucleotidase [Mesomycoplasma neurolyticum]|uniref:Bifunctional 2',3'-cyclic nucleotide 2'-phosphodiesterase/3'-nucleotidase protein n=1 Tax=Mesomycoplasma neurolyticum TaxID=2120 RepID=A0A449A4B3_9BACT|nr:bifunctional UDP-sugar hydrolase/5'-nucleotidase [Mesomycoplasma neurolyticum]VEU59079.1 bifunctional 2',3'-cyclic nucleotide 2'-phosphodiesterase/3'-nucleotidase precursor protein [Mesomycoplasma neurolyticum]
MKRKLKKSLLLLSATLPTMALVTTVVSCNNEYKEDSKELKQTRDLYFTTLDKYNENIEKFSKEYAEEFAKIDGLDKEIKKIEETNSSETDESKKNENTKKIKEKKGELSSKKEKLYSLLKTLNNVIKPLEKELDETLVKLRILEKDSRFKTIRIFHTNDEHGRLKTDFGKYNKYSGMQGVNNFVDDKTFDLLLSSGDLIQGLPLSDSDKGETITYIAKLMNYDSIAVGNHEFDYDLPQILKLNSSNSKKDENSLLNEEGTPFISANIYYKESAGEDKKDKRVFKPYKLKTLKNGLEVAIIGITTPDTVYTSHPDHSKDVVFKDPKTEAEKVIAEIKKDHPNVKLIIATVHLGVARNQIDWSSESLKDIKDLSLILDGHSHTKVPLEYDKSKITQTEAYTKYLGDISLIVDTKTKKIIKVQQHLRDINQVIYSKVSFIDKLIEKLEIEFNNKYDVLAFKLSKDLTHIGEFNIGETKYNLGRTQPSELGVIFSNALGYEFVNNVYQAQKDNEKFKTSPATLDNTIVLTNSGNIRTNLEKGDVKLSKMLEVNPFGNRIKAVKLKGSVILEVFKSSASRGTEGGFGQWSSNVSYKMTVSPETDKSKGANFKYTLDEDSIKINDKALDLNKNYYLVSNDFIFDGGDKYSVLDIRKEENKTKLDVVYEGGSLFEEVNKYIKMFAADNIEDTAKNKPFAQVIKDFNLDDIKKKQVVVFPETKK